MNPPIDYRIVTEIDELKQVIALQETVWGKNIATQFSQLVATIHNGGVVVGAYEGKKLVGFCYGFPGLGHGESYLCSHMLGILPEYRDCGIGKRLKLEQRKWALSYGYQKMTWTFDPLEARNAYLNLCKLGGIVRTYIPSYYGEMDDKINKGMPSDRFVLEWMLDSKRVKEAVQNGPIDNPNWRENRQLPILEISDDFPELPVQEEILDQTGYLIPVPRMIHELKRSNIILANKWRFVLREAFLRMFSAGYAVVGMIRSEEPVHYYVLEKKDRLME